MNEQIFTQKLAQAVREGRIRKGYRQDEICEIINLTRVSVVNIEKGKCSTTIYKIAILLKILDIQLPEIPNSFVVKAKNKLDKRAKLTKAKRLKRIDTQMKKLELQKNKLENI